MPESFFFCFFSPSTIEISPPRTQTFLRKSSPLYISDPSRSLLQCNSLRPQPQKNSIIPFFKSPSSLSLVLSQRYCHGPIQASSCVKSKSNGSQGAKLVPAAISVAIGLAIRFLIPKPVEVSTQAWQLLAIFVATNVGLMLSPLPIGAWAFLALTTSVVTKTLTFSNAFRGFTTDVIWLIVCSYFIARAFVRTGLGDRVATYFVKCFGKTALGLAYGLAFGEALVALAMPSTVARAGGVFLPMIKSILSLSSGGGSEQVGGSRRKLGSFLVMSQLHSAGNSSALFLTAAANNLLMLKLSGELGVQIANPWVSWFKAACLPAFVSLLATPFILSKVFPLEEGEIVDASAMATRKLNEMGPVTKNEWVMIGTMLFVVSLWMFGTSLGIASADAAMLGLSILLLLGVMNWDDCLSEKSAWGTFVWFSILSGMASQLSNLGFVAWLSDALAKSLQSLSLSWPLVFGVLQAAYFFMHYIFASQVAHIGALYSSFLAMHLAYGVPNVLAALTLSFNTSLFGALTHYSSAPAAAYYGAGIVDIPDFLRVGIMMAFVNAVIWGGVGTLWWKFLGLWQAF